VKFPLTLDGNEGVVIYPGEARGFLIFGNNSSSVGYGYSGQGENTTMQDENLQYGLRNKQKITLKSCTTTHTTTTNQHEV